MKKTWPIAVLLVAALGGVWWFLGSHDKPSHEHRRHSDAHDVKQPEPAVQKFPAPRVVKPVQVPHSAKVAKSNPTAAQQPTSKTVLDRQKRNEIRAKIYEAFGRPAPERDRLNPPGTMGSSVDLPGKLDKDYIKNIISDDFKPMARDCYKEAQKRHPGLAGKLVVEFTIIGYQNVGGIVEGANVMTDQGSLNDKELNKCVEDAMLSMAFDAPKDGGKVSVTYPFIFSPAKSDAGSKP